MVEKTGNPQPLGNICLQFLHIYGSLVQANIPQLAAGGWNLQQLLRLPDELIKAAPRAARVIC